MPLLPNIYSQPRAHLVQLYPLPAATVWATEALTLAPPNGFICKLWNYSIFAFRPLQCLFISAMRLDSSIGFYSRSVATRLCAVSPRRKGSFAVTGGAREHHVCVIAFHYVPIVVESANWRQLRDKKIKRGRGDSCVCCLLPTCRTISTVFTCFYIFTVHTYICIKCM